MLTILKLINGMEVVGQVVESTTKSITIDNPIQINYKNIEQPVPSVSLTRYMQFADTRQHQFNKRDILSMSGVMKGMELYYDAALEHFKTDVDQIVERELFRVSGSTTETTKEEYMAILERISTNQALN